MKPGCSLRALARKTSLKSDHLIKNTKFRNYSCRVTEACTFVLFLKHKDKRHFVDGPICNDVLVPCFHNRLRVIAAYHLKCVLQIHDWHCLHSEHVVTFENGDEVFLDEEPLLESVDVFIEGVFFAVVDLLNLL